MESRGDWFKIQRQRIAHNGVPKGASHSDAKPATFPLCRRRYAGSLNLGKLEMQMTDLTHLCSRDSPAGAAQVRDLNGTG